MKRFEADIRVTVEAPNEKRAKDLINVALTGLKARQYNVESRVCLERWIAEPKEIEESDGDPFEGVGDGYHGVGGRVGKPGRDWFGGSTRADAGFRE